MVRILRWSVFVLACVLGASGPSWAQISTAELNGRVTDTSGGVLPGATVSVTQTATGLNRTAVSDESGAYLLSNLPPGPYKLRSEEHTSELQSH